MSAVLRGPNDKAAFRDHPTDWHGYIDPLPADDIAIPTNTLHPSVSDIKKAWPKNLTDWAATEAAKSAWKFRGALATMTEQEAVDLIAPASNRQRDAAARRGHSIHDLLEHRLFHPDGTILFEDGDAAIQYVDTIRAIVENEQPEVVASEVVVFGELELNGVVHRWAGTFDAIWRINGRLILVDYKSRKHGKAATRYPEEGVQLGAYSAARYWVVEDDEHGVHRATPLELDGGMILSIAPDAYCKYDVDLDIARMCWAVTCEFKATQGSARTMFGKADKTKVESSTAAPQTSTGGNDAGTARTAGAPPVDAPTDPGDTADREAAEGSSSPGTSPGSAIDDRTQWVLDRIEVIKATPAALAEMASVWPSTVARPDAIRAGGSWTSDDITAICRALDHAEGVHEVPFGVPDPTLPAPDPAPVSVLAERLHLPEVDEGDDWATDQEVADLRALLKTLASDPASADLAARALQWSRDGHAQERPWNMGDPATGERTSRRRWAICSTAIGLLDLVDLDHDEPEWAVRAALALVLGDDVQQHAFHVGGLLGCLTTEQAVRLAQVVDTHRVATGDDGAPRLVAA